ncbi:unnamed protein product [Prorocentrum cordatum]|uniref:Uncharacterized protein n=1 Tax=Prorocentrum cordatum TaxID=2364126 RepID=A0ABN9PZZ0_9DINO|nr:unnamed protein product [Polarella glacialis]
MSSELQSKAVERLHRSAALRAEKRRLASKEKLAELEKQLHAESVHSAALSRLQPGAQGASWPYPGDRPDRRALSFPGFLVA